MLHLSFRLPYIRVGGGEANIMCFLINSLIWVFYQMYKNIVFFIIVFDSHGKLLCCNEKCLGKKLIAVKKIGEIFRMNVGCLWMSFKNYFHFYTNLLYFYQSNGNFELYITQTEQFYIQLLFLFIFKLYWTPVF